MPMGKAKKRNFQNCKSDKWGKNSLPLSCSRADAIKEAIKRIKDNDLSEDTKDIIGLFGISAEELGEAGATYEELKALKTMFL